MGKAFVAVIVVLVLIALIFFAQYVSVRNTLVTKNEAVKAAWSWWPDNVHSIRERGFLSRRWVR